MNAQELLERYVNEVGHHLPLRSRKDIQQELLSLLHDDLDERAADSGKEPTVATAAALLHEYGPPKQMAAEYQNTQYLIGPNLFPLYKLVITIVLAAFAGIYGISLVSNLLSGDVGTFSEIVFGVIGTYWDVAVGSIGTITIVFFIIERVFDSSEFQLDEKDEAWDPLALPPVNNPDRISRFELLAGIVGGAIFGSMFAFFAVEVRMPIYLDGEWQFMRLITDHFLSYFPWLAVSFGLEILINGLVLWRGKWERWTRGLDLASELFGLGILVALFFGPLMVFGLPLSETIAKVVLGLIILLVVVESLKKIYHVLNGRSIVDVESLKRRFVG